MTRRDDPTVLFVDHCAQPSGAQLALEGLLKSLSSRDDVHLGGLVALSSGPMIERWARFVESEQLSREESVPAGLSRHGLDLRAVPGLLRQAIGLRRTIKRFRREHTGGIVYFNTLRSFAIARPLIPRSTPVVVHIRDRLAGYYGDRATRLLLRFLPRANAIIANSAGTAGEYISAGLPESDVTVIPSPLRSEFLVDSAPATTKDRHVIAAVGTVSPWKGQHLAIQAVGALRDDGIDVDLHVIGAPLFGEVEYDRRLRDEAAAVPGRSIVFHGHVDDVAGLLRDLGAGCLLHTTTLPEPLGMAVVEGMALGLTVVAADSGGPAEIIDHGVTGFLFETGSIESLISTLRTAIGPAGLSVAEQAPDAVRSKFHPDGIAARTIEVLRTC